MFSNRISASAASRLATKRRSRKSATYLGMSRDEHDYRPYAAIREPGPRRCVATKPLSVKSFREEV